jgi:hypothetical protein
MFGGGTSRKMVTLKAEEVGGSCEDAVWMELALR